VFSSSDLGTQRKTPTLGRQVVVVWLWASHVVSRSLSSPGSFGFDLCIKDQDIHAGCFSSESGS
jgi:hypothetical protein